MMTSLQGSRGIHKQGIMADGFISARRLLCDIVCGTDERNVAQTKLSLCRYRRNTSEKQTICDMAG
jgi:hypothetical protein